MKNTIPFLDASHALENNIPSQSYGVSIFDIDGDNDVEILVSNAYSENIIYKYCEEKNKFIDVAPSNFKANNKATLSMCVGDFLGNGKASVYMMHSDTFEGIKTHYDSIFSYINKKQNKFEFKEHLGANSTMSNPFSGRSVAAVDSNGIGKHNYYVVNYSAPSLFYSFNKSQNKIEEISENLGLQQFACGRSVVAQYILNGNSVDIYVGNEDEGNHFYTRDKDGNYHEIASKLILSDALNHSRGMFVADFDGNGLADIVIGNWDSQNSIFMQRKPNRFENNPPPFFSLPRKIRGIIVADFDNDGFEEVFVNTFGEKNMLFRYLGNDDWIELEIGQLACPDLFGTGAAIGDLTGNGFLDIFICMGEKKPQENKLFLGVPNDNKWLRIQPLTVNGFPALGAKVRMYGKNTRNQTKYICSGSSYLCQMEPVAHFGLGNNEPQIECIEITWPGSGTQPPPTKKIDGSEIHLNSFYKIPHPNS